MALKLANLSKQTVISDRYLDREVTDSIKGFFILTVFYRHVMPYLNDQNAIFSRRGQQIVNIFNICDSFLGQLIVTMFLFYSGYGVMCAILNKREAYICKIPKKRILSTLLNFMVAVSIFWLMQTLIQSH